MADVHVKLDLAPTVLTTPLVGPVARWVAMVALRLLGWRVEGQAPAQRQYVLVAAPHTSNWDGLYLVLIASVLRIPIRWLGKHTLFRFPFAPIMRWFGGIAVDRRGRSDTVGRVAGLFERYAELVIVVPPAGTRARGRRWKTGFYYIAVRAQVPIALGFLDYARKTGGIGPIFEPSGDLETDLPHIRAFYADKTGRRQEEFGNVESAARESAANSGLRQHDPSETPDDDARSQAERD